MEPELNLGCLKLVSVSAFGICDPIVQPHFEVDRLILDETSDGGCSNVVLCIPPKSGFGKLFYVGRVNWNDGTVSHLQSIYPKNLANEKGSQPTLLGFASSPFGNFLMTKAFDVYHVQTTQLESTPTDLNDSVASPLHYNFVCSSPDPILRLECIKDGLVLLTKRQFIVITRDESTNAFVTRVERELSAEEVRDEGPFVGMNFLRDYSVKTDLPYFVFYQSLKLNLNTELPVYERFQNLNERKKYQSESFSVFSHYFSHTVDRKYSITYTNEYSQNEFRFLSGPTLPDDDYSDWQEDANPVYGPTFSVNRKNGAEMLEVVEIFAMPRPETPTPAPYLFCLVSKSRIEFAIHHHLAHPLFEVDYTGKIVGKFDQPRSASSWSTYDSRKSHDPLMRCCYVDSQRQRMVWVLSGTIYLLNFDEVLKQRIAEQAKEIFSEIHAKICTVHLAIVPQEIQTAIGESEKLQDEIEATQSAMTIEIRELSKKKDELVQRLKKDELFCSEEYEQLCRDIHYIELFKQGLPRHVKKSESYKSMQQKLRKMAVSFDTLRRKNEDMASIVGEKFSIYHAISCLCDLNFLYERADTLSKQGRSLVTRFNELIPKSSWRDDCFTKDGALRVFAGLALLLRRERISFIEESRSVKIAAPEATWHVFTPTREYEDKHLPPPETPPDSPRLNVKEPLRLDCFADSTSQEEFLGKYSMRYLSCISEFHYSPQIVEFAMYRRKRSFAQQSHDAYNHIDQYNVQIVNALGESVDWYSYYPGDKFTESGSKREEPNGDENDDENDDENAPTERGDEEVRKVRRWFIIDKPIDYKIYISTKLDADYEYATRGVCVNPVRAIRCRLIDIERHHVLTCANESLASLAPTATAIDYTNPLQCYAEIVVYIFGFLDASHLNQLLLVSKFCYQSIKNNIQQLFRAMVLSSGVDYESWKKSSDYQCVRETTIEAPDDPTSLVLIDRPSSILEPVEAKKLASQLAHPNELYRQWVVRFPFIDKWMEKTAEFARGKIYYIPQMVHYFDTLLTMRDDLVGNVGVLGGIGVMEGRDLGVLLHGGCVRQFFHRDTASNNNKADLSSDSVVRDIDFIYFARGRFRRLSNAKEGLMDAGCRLNDGVDFLFDNYRKVIRISRSVRQADIPNLLATSGGAVNFLRTRTAPHPMDFFVEGYDSDHFPTSNLEFTVNGLYYDPIMGILYDESGYGVADAMERVLRLFEPREKWEEAMKHGPKLMRYWIFRVRGYKPCDSELEAFMMNQLEEHYQDMQIFKHFHSSKVGVLRTIYAYYTPLLDLFDEKFGVDHFGEFFPRLDPNQMPYAAFKKLILLPRMALEKIQREDEDM